MMIENIKEDEDFFFIYLAVCKEALSGSYFLNLCDCSVPYWASLEACNWVVAGQHINASHPRSSTWPNPKFKNFHVIIL